MGNKDIATKKYMSDNVRFADVFNYAIYGGRQIIKHDMLKEISAEELLLMEGRMKANYKGQSKKGLRRRCHKEKAYVFTCFAGIENASSSLIYPASRAAYDFIGYIDRVERKSKENRRKKTKG